MGSQRMYIPEGGFHKFLYVQQGDIFRDSKGLEAKIVEKIDGTEYDGLPTFSNTREIYLKTNKNGDIIQARIYKNRKPICDFDFDHDHTNKNGEVFPRGIVHVQEWKTKSNGELYRDSRHA